MGRGGRAMECALDLGGRNSAEAPLSLGGNEITLALAVWRRNPGSSEDVDVAFPWGQQQADSQAVSECRAGPERNVVRDCLRCYGRQGWCFRNAMIGGTLILPLAQGRNGQRHESMKKMQRRPESEGAEKLSTPSRSWIVRSAQIRWPPRPSLSLLAVLLCWPGCCPLPPFFCRLDPRETGS